MATSYLIYNTSEEEALVSQIVRQGIKTIDGNSELEDWVANLKLNDYGWKGFPYAITIGKTVDNELVVGWNTKGEYMYEYARPSSSIEHHVYLNGESIKYFSSPAMDTHSPKDSKNIKEEDVRTYLDTEDGQILLDELGYVKKAGYVVRFNGRDNNGDYLYLQNKLVDGHIVSHSVYQLTLATCFKTRTKAESWTNAHQEVISYDQAMKED